MKILQSSTGNTDIAIRSTETISLPYRFKNKSNSLPQRAKQNAPNEKKKKKQLNVKIHTHFLKLQEENYLSYLDQGMVY